MKKLIKQLLREYDPNWARGSEAARNFKHISGFNADWNASKYKELKDHGKNPVQDYLNSTPQVIKDIVYDLRELRREWRYRDKVSQNNINNVISFIKGLDSSNYDNDKIKLNIIIDYYNNNLPDQFLEKTIKHYNLG